MHKSPPVPVIRPRMPTFFIIQLFLVAVKSLSNNLIRVSPPKKLKKIGNKIMYDRYKRDKGGKSPDKNERREQNQKVSENKIHYHNCECSANKKQRRRSSKVRKTILNHT